MGEEELRELRNIKRLLTLQLLSSGIQAKTIADILEIDPGHFSREFPVRKLMKNKK